MALASICGWCGSTEMKRNRDPKQRKNMAFRVGMSMRFNLYFELENQQGTGVGSGSFCICEPCANEFQAWVKQYRLSKGIRK